MWRYSIKLDLINNLVNLEKQRNSYFLHKIAEKLGIGCALSLFFLHAFSVCVTVSSFCNISKRTVWDVGPYDPYDSCT